jgi:putative ABC transport system ATP-binding protein
LIPYPALMLSPSTRIVRAGVAAPAAGLAHASQPNHKPSTALATKDRFALNDTTDTATAIVLEAEDLTKQVSSPEGSLTIVDHVSLQIRAGESVAIVGASGAGKSTLLALLAGLDTPTSGRVILAGSDLTTLDEDGRAKLRAERVGFVFQSFHLVPALTALENVMLPLELAGRRDARAGALEALEQVGLRERTGHYPRQLSGGEQQRVAMARAFVTRPAVLFADEPTGNLDTVTGARITQMLFDMNANAHTTVVLVTHDRELASRCGRMLIMEGGRLA